MSDAEIRIERLTGALGAEVQGIDLSRSLSNAQVDAIHRAFLDNQVIFFRDQSITPEDHLRFARLFGELDIHPFAAGLDDHPEIMPVVKEAEDHVSINFGGTWHSDVSFYEKPALGSVLYAIEVPDAGGDTMFANMYLAYEALSDGLKDTLDGLQAVHSASRSFGLNSRATRRSKEGGDVSMTVNPSEEAENEVVHPVIRTHPETGRKLLFVNYNFTQRFVGWTAEESAPLLKFLWDHAARPEFTCRFRWRKGSVAFWDNRCTQHLALNDYHGSRREMHRVTICGDKPV
ncbi:MAG: TauD/TfdA family dioxygenase [Hyphomicrobiaceae bacterium]|nr:TauD/TfdA family dioxygenase [Hyphomicrobiaceae bacterium]